MDSDEESFAVGYGKPPRQHRFKAGNKAAAGPRKRKAKGLKATIERVMAEKQPVKINDKYVTMTNEEIIARKLVSAAQASDKDGLSAVKFLMSVAPAAMSDEASYPPAITVSFVSSGPLTGGAPPSSSDYSREQDDDDTGNGY